MGSKDYPQVSGSKYHGVSQYLIGKLSTTDTYQCTSIDAERGYINVMCMDEKGDFDVSISNDCTKEGSLCNIQTCETLKPKYCMEPTDFYLTDDEGYVGICVKDTEGVTGMCKRVSNGDLIRPDDSHRSTSHANKWYIGDETYGFGFHYTCEDKTDNINGYMNTLCLNETQDIVVDGMVVYCLDPTDIDTDTDTDIDTDIDTDTDIDIDIDGAAHLDSTYKKEMYVEADCTAKQCSSILNKWCETDTDLYRIDPHNRDKAIFIETCIMDFADGDNKYCVRSNIYQYTGFFVYFLVLALF